MVRDAHRPTEYHVLCGGIAGRHLVDFVFRDAALSDDLLPAERPQPFAQFGPAVAMLSEERFVTGPQFEHSLGQAVEHRQVAPNMRLDVLTGDLRAEQHTTHVAWHTEVHHAGLDYRIDDNHLAAAATYFHQRSHQSRMV